MQLEKYGRKKLNNMFEYVKNKFIEFVENSYDLKDDKVRHKLNHTLHVVDNSKYLCDKLNLDDETKEIAMIIALLHDIGRFDQAKKLKSFREDINNYDHATLGVKLLFENNLIRNFISNDKYDEVIKTAIANHSKYIVDFDSMDATQILHSKLIRDADKLDSFRAKYENDIYTMANITKEEIENSLISDNILNDFMNERTILSKDRKTPIDIWISYIAFIYGLYFKESLNFINENDYVNKLVNKFEYKLKDTKEKIEQIRNKGNNYISNI